MPEYPTLREASFRAGLFAVEMDRLLDALASLPADKRDDAVAEFASLMYSAKAIRVRRGVEGFFAGSALIEIEIVPVEDDTDGV